MSEVTRKSFIAGAASIAAVMFSLADGGPRAASPVSALRPPAYDALRAELRAFYPLGYCRNDCQSQEQVASCAAIGRELDAWAAAHPGFDALDIRRESYLAMRRHFVPFLFANSPFYFEAGVNGGWSGARPRLRQAPAGA